MIGFFSLFRVPAYVLWIKFSMQWFRITFGRWLVVARCVRRSKDVNLIKSLTLNRIKLHGVPFFPLFASFFSEHPHEHFLFPQLQNTFERRTRSVSIKMWLPFFLLHPKLNRSCQFFSGFFSVLLFNGKKEWFSTVLLMIRRFSKSNLYLLHSVSLLTDAHKQAQRTNEQNEHENLFDSFD